MSDVEENVVQIDNKELKESEMTDQQKYFARQIQDLRNKRARVQFELDQIQASLSVFENSLVESAKNAADNILQTETKILGDK